MGEMIGTCRYCQQQKVVSAEDQESADAAATLDCDCEGGEFERRKEEVRDQLDRLIGEKAPDNGWPATTPATFNAIADMADLVVAGDIASIEMRIDDTKLKIGRSKSRIGVERSMTIKQGGQIEK